MTELGEHEVGPEEGGFGKALGGDPGERGGGLVFDVDEVGAAVLGEAVEEEGPVVGFGG
jgi:hypothetical protein